MSNIKKIEKLHFHNFRSYSDEVFHIDKEANLILLYGNNGLGKTAFFDGIEWGLTGNLRRYNDSAKEKKEYPVLSNIFKEANDNSFVSIQFDDKSSITREVLHKDENDFNKGKIHQRFNINSSLVNPYYNGFIKFEDNFSFSQFLSQELINMFIRGTKDTERYEAVVNLFGLSRYNQYNSFFKTLISAAAGRRESIKQAILDKETEIKVLEGKIAENSIDVNIKAEELNSLSDIKIDLSQNDKLLDNLNRVKKHYLDRKNTINEEIRGCNIDLKKLEHTKLSFDENEKKLIEAEGLKGQLPTLNHYVQTLERYNHLSYIIKNINAYSIYSQNPKRLNELEEDHNKKGKTYEVLYNIVSGSNENAILNLKDFYKESNVKVNQYIDILSNANKIKGYINELEGKLHEKASLKQEFLRITIKHLENNMTFNTCPVCKNSIDINETLKELFKEINAESDSIFLDIREQIERYKDKLEHENLKLKTIKQDIQNESKHLLEKTLDELKEIEKEISTLKEYKQSYTKINQLLSNYGLKIDDVRGEFNRVSGYIKENNITGSIDDYKYQLETIEGKLYSYLNTLKEYESIKKKHNIRHKEDISQSIDSTYEKLQSSNKGVDTADAIIRLSAELSLYFNSCFAKNNITVLREKLKKYREEVTKLDKIEETYISLSKNTRSSVEDQTKKILNVYGNTIKQIYSYLNPNLKFSDFEIRIDSSNPKNNRMIFEVAGLNGKKMSPSYSFSAAQNNVLAVSLFLSFALTQKWSRLNCIFMDDPIQNMDDINVHNFVDILRNVINKTDKQIFISTHDDRIFNYIKNKFTSNIQTFEFVDYGKIKKNA